MFMQELKLPEIMKYYISADCMANIKNALNNNISINNDSKYIIISTKYSASIYDALKYFLSKTEKITVGNCRLYEYELDSYNSAGRLFHCLIDNISYELDLEFVEINNDNMTLKFESIK